MSDFLRDFQIVFPFHNGAKTLLDLFESLY